MDIGRMRQRAETIYGSVSMRPFFCHGHLIVLKTNGNRLSSELSH